MSAKSFRFPVTCSNIIDSLSCLSLTVNNVRWQILDTLCTSPCEIVQAAFHIQLIDYAVGSKKCSLIRECYVYTANLGAQM